MSTQTNSTPERRDIDGKGRTLWELFDNRRYAVDNYQREYKWQTKQLVELVDDLCGKFLEHYEAGQERDAVDKYGHYFLGSIILSQKKGQSYIIDGQQRLTTLTLFLIYLHHRQQKLPEDERVPVHQLILSQKFGKKSYNIDVPERAPCLDKLYSGQPYNPTTKDPEAVRNMVARYQEIEENFPPDINDPALPYFLDWLLNNVHVVEITAYSDDDAYTIFETMNDRGLSLAPLDMLKSFLIANITDELERDRINGIWKQTTNRLLELDEEEPADAVKTWLRSQYADSIRERKKGAKAGDFDRLGTEFHRWVRENEKRLFLVKSADYVHFIERDFRFYTDQYELLSRASGQKPLPGLEIVYANSWLQFTLQYPLLLAPLKPSDDEQTRLHKFQSVASFVDILIARRLWNYRSIAYSTMQYAMFLIMREIRGKSLDQLVGILRKRLDEVGENFDTNPTLRLHGMNRYSLKWLLARMTEYIEVHGGLASRFPEYMTEGRKNTYDIEHVWANHWEEHDEFKHKADFDEYRNRFGALLLLPKTFNSSYGDLPYREKLPHYLNQNLLAQSLNPDAYDYNPPLTKLVQEGLPFKGHMEFRKKDIETRQELYVAIAKQVWNPDRLNSAAA
jgi:uncharacterized protein with ParB-like and HNH nuclease domain